MLPLKQIDDALPKKGIIYEIGSGHGLISRYLAMASPRRKIIGIDIDRNKIDHHPYQPNALFYTGDAIEWQYEDCEGAVLSDFLHHLKNVQQNIMLERIAKKIKKGGVLVIKEVDAKDGIRTMLARLYDYILYPKDSPCYLSKENLYNFLEHLGFFVTVNREVKYFPSSTHLFICIKR